MTYNQHPNTFSFHQFVKVQSPQPNYQTPASTEPLGDHLLQSAHPNVQIILNKIDATT